MIELTLDVKSCADCMMKDYIMVPLSFLLYSDVSMLISFKVVKSGDAILKCNTTFHFIIVGLRIAISYGEKI